MVEVTGRRGRRCKQLLEEPTENRGHCKMQEEAVYRSLWRTCFGRGHESVIRQQNERITITDYKYTS